MRAIGAAGGQPAARASRKGLQDRLARQLSSEHSRRALRMMVAERLEHNLLDNMKSEEFEVNPLVDDELERASRRTSRADLTSDGVPRGRRADTDDLDELIKLRAVSSAEFEPAQPAPLTLSTDAPTAFS